MEKLNTTAAERIEMLQSFNRRATFMRELKPETEYSFQPPRDDVLLHTLIIKQAILGKDVEPTDLCMLEVETKTDAGTTETFPLAYLRGTDMLQVSLELIITEPAKIKLAKGKGPVFIIGEYTQEWKEDEAAEESVDGDVEVDPESENEDEEVKEDVEDKENAGVTTNGVAAAIEAAADRKRKHEDTDLVGAKKLRVSKSNEESEEAMDEVAEKIGS